MKRNFSQIDWSWGEPPAQCSATEDFGAQDLSRDTLKKWRWPMRWLRTLRWYWAQLEWSTEGMDDTFDLVPCVPWLLLARDFSLATHVQITDVAGQPSLHFTLRGISGSSCPQWGVKSWPGVQTYPVMLFESCGIAKLAGIQGRPKLLQPELSLGSL